MRRYATLLFTALLLGTALSGRAAVWSLRECIDYARRNNIQVQSAGVSSATTGVNLLQAQARLTPSLSFSTGQVFPDKLLFLGKAELELRRVCETGKKAQPELIRF